LVKRTGGLLLLLIVLVAASIGAILLRAQKPEQTGGTARITIDGALYQTIDLNVVSAPCTIEIPWEGEGSSVIAVDQGRIRVASADCPDQICVHQGWISDGTVPIVCLPHRLAIEIVGGEDTLDTATG